jgi:sugar lactone lactonase YvrE
MLFVIVCLSVVAGCGVPHEKEKAAESKLLTPKLLYTLADQYDSPDGMTIGKDGNIYLAMNSAGKEFKFKHPAKIMRITADDKLEEVGDLPPHPETKVASPLGIVFGPDGNLYISDCQAFAGGNKKSRVLRMTIKDGKAVKTATVVEGMQMANGIAVNGDYLYVNETDIDAEAKPMISGVYRFKIADLDPDNVIKVNGMDNPYFFLKVETDYANDFMKVGANGIDFDSKGNMYVCNFGEASVLKVTLKADGSVDQVTTLCKGQGMESTDGCHIDQNDDLWIADFVGNAIAKVCTHTGGVTIVAKNQPGDGIGGALDAPSECIRRGDKVYVSNIDITHGPNTHDDLQTMSVIDL